MVTYTKKENAEYKKVQEHLKVLEERTRQLRADIRKRKKAGRYNATDPKRIFTKVKKAKMYIADAGYI